MKQNSQAAMSPDQIHQPRDEFGYRFVSLARSWRRVIDLKLAESGLSDADWAPLMYLHLSGDGITQSELAARAGVDSSTMVRLIDRLSERGLVERRIAPTDRRARLIYLTPAAAVEITRIRRELAGIEHELLADLSDTQVQSILQALELIAARTQAALSPAYSGDDA
ncbi:MAG TPA: MarR family transcriptional regulator [Paenirhodobacter sp.]